MLPGGVPVERRGLKVGRLELRAFGALTRQEEISMGPTLTNGKICYLEIPAVDLPRSVLFYQTVFGWAIRRRGDGTTAFDDAVGQVSGTWVVGRPPSREPGLLLYIMVDSAAATIDAVIAHGGELVQPIGADAPEVTARFRDPAGNVIGLYQQPGNSGKT
jgi:predicted enzyme related to lactoylglutathione lyase